jgi:hypothetical protein
MKYHAALLVVALAAAPAFAQNPDEDAVRELGMFGVYSLGNLALNDIQRGNDPVQQMKRFFAQEQFPLTSAQEKSLNALIDSEVKMLQTAGQNEDAVKRVNADYMKKLNEILNTEQRAELRRYRAEQIMLRGGFRLCSWFWKMATRHSTQTRRSRCRRSTWNSTRRSTR